MEWAFVPEKFILNADIQARYVAYNTKGIDNDQRSYDVNVTSKFLNPKVGLRYFIRKSISVYASVAHSGKEPNRSDYVDAAPGNFPKNEYMIDYEAGLHVGNSKKIIFDVNAYFMNYNNQLVLTGALNDVGAPLRTNVAKSFRRGIELSTSLNVSRKLKAGGNITLSENKIVDFNERVFNYDTYMEEVVSRGTTDIAFSPNLIAALNLDYQVFKTESAGSQLNLLFNEKFVGKQHLDNTGSSTAVLTAFAVSDLGIQWSSKIASGSNLKVTLWTNNVLNRIYSSNGYAYSYIYGGAVTERFYYPQAGRNFMLNFAVEL
jgi:iron complex outermembrane receptor protein